MLSLYRHTTPPAFSWKYYPLHPLGNPEARGEISAVPQNPAFLRCHSPSAARLSPFLGTRLSAALHPGRPCSAEPELCMVLVSVPGSAEKALGREPLHLSNLGMVRHRPPALTQVSPFQLKQRPVRNILHILCSIKQELSWRSPCCPHPKISLYSTNTLATRFSFIWIPASDHPAKAGLG